MTSFPTRFHEDLAAVLELLKDYDATSHGWQEIDGASTDETIQVYRRNGPPGKMELNFRMLLPISVETTTSWIRAEAPPEDSPMADLFEEFVCLKSFGPGDMICTVKFVKWYAAMLDLLMGLKWPDTIGQTLLTRLVTRRDCPEPGVTFFGGLLVENTCPVPLWGMVIMEGPQPETTAMHELWQFPTMRQELLQPVIGHMCRIYSKQNWEGDAEQLEERNGFIVMTIRKCCRGPPLLPVAPQGNLETMSEEWLDALTWDVYEDPSEFTLPLYMRYLLACFGKKEIEIFDQLDGRHLLFYQAAARRSDWLEIWGIWQLFVRRHSSAYRRKLGGSGAPGFQGDVPPRFGTSVQPRIPESTTSASTPQEEEEQEEYPWTWGLPIKNTFVHFPSDRTAFDLQSSPV
eukprot:CAMPEP_0206468426 /NCGR_PEP_ID=MMETSP0324_2-20121206/29617_1 /ASSEMBLY_ACC=CAM_ASM_000836 /TAXON_ID=2866 /ORGANISM="Crypthecodinium cohnii, Strain Seligo" /LENGTH=401 /DNA_ID=CAMNT_0053941871 /DNA_START=35 /DNA_END=1240 /DNA_ORIENTATION=-